MRYGYAASLSFDINEIGQYGDTHFNSTGISLSSTPNLFNSHTLVDLCLRFDFAASSISRLIYLLNTSTRRPQFRDMLQREGDFAIQPLAARRPLRHDIAADIARMHDMPRVGAGLGQVSWPKLR